MEFNIVREVNTKYPELKKQGWVDFNKNGIKDENEELKDVDGDGKIGSERDYYVFVGANNKYIAQSREIPNQSEPAIKSCQSDPCVKTYGVFRSACCKNNPTAPSCQTTTESKTQSEIDPCVKTYGVFRSACCKNHSDAPSCNPALKEVEAPKPPEEPSKPTVEAPKPTAADCHKQKKVLSADGSKCEECPPDKPFNKFTQKCTEPKEGGGL